MEALIVSENGKNFVRAYRRGERSLPVIELPVLRETKKYYITPQVYSLQIKGFSKKELEHKYVKWCKDNLDIAYTLDGGYSNWKLATKDKDLLGRKVVRHM